MLIEDAVSSGTPQFVIDSYATLAERAKTQSFGLIEEDVIVLDTETTGLSVQDNELIEISAARLSGREVVDRFDTFVHPKQLIPAEITSRAVCGNAGEGYIDTAVKVLIAVVLGALVLAGLYAILNDTVMPTVTQKITEMFSYNG